MAGFFIPEKWEGLVIYLKTEKLRFEKWTDLFSAL